MEDVTLEEALELILSRVKTLQETEPAGLMELQGRILAEDIISPIDNPPFARAPIDGYACRSEDLTGASKDTPSILKVMEEVDAGQYSHRVVEKGQAVRIMTGAAIPAGCDCCVRQESTDYGEEEVQIYESIGAWKNYCFQGEDFKKGTLMISKGTKLGYVEAGVLASMGCTEAMVYRQPRVTLLTTGSEVTAPGEPLLPGKIYNSNLTLLAARLKEFGIRPIAVQTVGDDAASVAKALKNASQKSDLIVSTGGVSVGKKDVLHEALTLAGAERIFWRVRLKPGSPLIFSVLENIPVLSLSGNPFGAAANFELLVRPALAKLTGDDILKTLRTTAVMADAFPKASPGRRFIRAILKDGNVYMPKGIHSSGALGSLLGCNCMVDIKPGTAALSEGDQVEVVIL